MDKPMNMDIKDIVALFHTGEPRLIESYEIRNQPGDSRWIAYIEDCGRKYVIKIAANAFTTVERIRAWPGLIAEFSRMGYYSPSIIPSLNGRIAETIVFRNVQCVVWEEEYARYRFAEALPKSGGMPTWFDGLIEFMGRTAQLHLSGFPGKSGWVRLEPFAPDELTDEIAECEETFDQMVRDLVPEYLPRWKEIKRLFDVNRERLREVYGRLPTSVFQGDWGEGNLLVDEHGRFAGMIDYNLSGKDTALNMFLSMSLHMGMYEREFSKYESDPNELPFLNSGTRERVIAHMLYVFERLRKHYRFSEEEVQAAPLLYKYIATVEYAAIDALRLNAGNPARLDQLFDFLRHELLRDDIDFRTAMLG